MIFEGRKILIISLSRTGCIEYAKEMRDRLASVSPILICSHQAKDYFKDYHEVLYTYNGKKDFAKSTIKFYTKCSKIISQYQKEHQDLTIYFPVFHPWNLIIARVAKKRNIPVVTTVHDFKTHIGERSKIVESVQNRIIKQSELLIFLTENEKKRAIQSLPRIKKKAFVLEHPLLKVSSENKLPHTKKLNLLFLGRLKKYKGFQMLSEIADQLDVGQITIAGHGPPECDISSNVNFINKYLSEAEIQDLIQSHHVLVLPYLEASQSGVITLGIQSEMVMIISDLKGLREQVDRDSAIWIRPNKEALLKAIRFIQKDSEKYLEIKRNIDLTKRTFEEKWSLRLSSLLSK